MTTNPLHQQKTRQDEYKSNSTPTIDAALNITQKLPHSCGCGENHTYYILCKGSKDPSWICVHPEAQQQGMVSLWSLAVIAFERWLVICKPLGNFIFKPDHAIACCAFTWFFAVFASAPPLFGWSRYIPEGLQCSCGPDWYTTNNKYNNESYVMFLFCFCFAVPLTTIIFCYSQLLITLKMAAKAQAESASTQKAEREVTRMVVIMVLGFLVCWMPYASFALWVVNNRGQSFDLRFATIPSCFSKASAVYNPVIYVVFNKQFRTCMLAMMGMGGGEEESSTTQSVTEVSKVGPA
ncbi:blue-sensitive opsin isoform X2 [Maylandia zebra]|uniref:blue-sensitive opsin isoform X2 n=1 Tax=Maylandia zebra TaxID=106582 RepID=UPI00403CE3F4